MLLTFPDLNEEFHHVYDEASYSQLGAEIMQESAFCVFFHPTAKAA
jgi:hypothetical protein